MKKENFEGLLGSVREAKQILRGEIKPAREFFVEIDASNMKKSEGYVLCVKTDDPKLLVVSKIYRARFSSNGKVGVFDEAGESAIYPSDFFIRIEIASEVEDVLENLQKAA